MSMVFTIQAVCMGYTKYEHEWTPETTKKKEGVGKGRGYKLTVPPVIHSYREALRLRWQGGVVGCTDRVRGSVSDIKGETH